VSRVFRRRGNRIEVTLDPREIEVVRAAPILLEGGLGTEGDPDWAHRRDVAHPADPDAQDRFRELTGEMLDEARAADRDRLTATLEEPSLSLEDAEAWMRVIGDARLLLAARIGIDEDGWGEAASADEPVEMSVLRFLGYLQDSLVVELMGAL
jgi:hypothetical protein